MRRARVSRFRHFSLSAERPPPGARRFRRVPCKARLGQVDSALIGFWERIFHVPRRRSRDGFAAIPGHYLQRHVNAGGVASGSEQGGLLNEMLSFFDDDVWKQLLHPVKRTPVRSSSLAVEESGFAEQ